MAAKKKVAKKAAAKNTKKAAAKKSTAALGKKKGGTLIPLTEGAAPRPTVQRAVAAILEGVRPEHVNVVAVVIERDGTMNLFASATGTRMHEHIATAFNALEAKLKTVEIEKPTEGEKTAETTETPSTETVETVETPAEEIESNVNDDSTTSDVSSEATAA